MADADLTDALDDAFSGTPDAVWDLTRQMGLLGVGIDEACGGAGGTVADQAAIAFAVGKHKVRAPIVETILASSALAACGLDVTAHPLAFSPGDRRDDVRVVDGHADGLFHDVPWAQDAAGFVGVVTTGSEPTIIVAAPGEFTVGTSGADADLAGQPISTVAVHHATAVNTDWPARLSHSLLRSAQIAGALEAIAALTHRYTRERTQFGKPIAAFQAVTQHLVTVEQAAVATRIAVERAAGLASAGGHRGATFEIGATHLVVDHHAALALAAAHQAHGAIGMTMEYPLAHYARLIHSWRALTRGHSVSAQHIGWDAVGHVARLIAREGGR
ncbi:acyl-CoA dehydrogenase family protein [Microbacterium luticocti]|uniref:acyl-CoA dehydrogenase family protein n=1 Tax=Microbacterium luticocti TaxID=451764 RepID=UPI00146BBC27|nr:acyl-CoA dehydrogenase family protein [Microbacterium luticocti]